MGLDTGKGLQESSITGLSCTRDLMQTSVIVHSIVTSLEVFIHALPHFRENQGVKDRIGINTCSEREDRKNYFFEEKSFQDYMFAL